MKRRPAYRHGSCCYGHGRRRGRSTRCSRPSSMADCWSLAYLNRPQPTHPAAVMALCPAPDLRPAVTAEARPRGYFAELLREVEEASVAVTPEHAPRVHFERSRNWPRHEDKL